MKKFTSFHLSLSLSSSLSFFISSLLFSTLSSSLSLHLVSSLVLLLLSSSPLSIFSCLFPSLLSHDSSHVLLLLLSCLLFSFLVLSRLSFSVSLCLSLSLSVCLSVCVVWCVWCCVCGVVCVWCGVCCWPVCMFKNASVCTFKTPPCEDSKRPRVYGHHARMCYHMRAWCRYTRGRFECTHGREGRGRGRGGPRQFFCFPKFAHVGLSRCFRGSPQETFASYTFKVPDSSDHSLT